MFTRYIEKSEFDFYVKLYKRDCEKYNKIKEYINECIKNEEFIEKFIDNFHCKICFGYGKEIKTIEHDLDCLLGNILKIIEEK